MVTEAAPRPSRRNQGAGGSAVPSDHEVARTPWVRTGFAFSSAGRYAACLTATRPGEWTVEVWPLEPPGRPRILDTPDIPSARCQVLPLDDGRVLLCGSEGLELFLLGAHAPVRLAGFEGHHGLRLLPLAREGSRPGAHAIAVQTTGQADQPSSRVWLVTELALEPVRDLPGLLAGGTWLDGDRLALTHVDRGTVRGIQLDIDCGTAGPVFPDRSDTRVLLANRHLWIVGWGPHRLGWTRPDDDRVRWPESLAPHEDRVPRPLAIAPDGSTALLTTRDGLHRFDSDDERLLSCPLPPGVPGATASWTAHGLWLPFQPADGTARVGRLTGVDGDPHLEFAGDPAPSVSVVPRMESIEGVPVIVYGDPATTPTLLALHGGPDAQWSPAADPVLSTLADRGLAVVAVNPPGGENRVESDLAAVLTVACHLRDVGGRLLRALGSSYGGHLALQALRARPELWDRAVLLAPFDSPVRLRAVAGPRVRALLDRCGVSGHDTRTEGRVDASVLVIAGSRDHVVPVSHVRELVEQLRSDCTTGVRYDELPNTGHDLLLGSSTADVVDRVGAWLDPRCRRRRESAAMT